MADEKIVDRSFEFAVRIIRCYQFLSSTHKEFVLSKQLLRSGTSIGANVTEAQQAQSKKDFLAKMSIALKEASETKYWNKLLIATGYLTEEKSEGIYRECVIIEKTLSNIVKTTKEKI